MNRNFQKFLKSAPIGFGLIVLFGLITPAVGGEQFKTKRGKVYHDCELVSKDDYGIMIRHRGGAARLAYADLPVATQQRFNYSKDAATKFVRRHTPTPVPVRSSQIANQRAFARFFNGFSPNYAATRAHLAFASGLVGAPFGGSLGVPGVRSFDAWNTDASFASQNPYHVTHRSEVKDGYVHLTNRTKSRRYDAGRHYQYAYQPQRSPSYLLNQANYGVPIAPAMNVNHLRATNGANPIAPAMMSYSQFQDARARAIRNAPVRRAVPRGGGGRGK